MRLINTKMNLAKPRVYRRKRRGLVSPRLLVKCSCCAEQLEIYYDIDDEMIEINGVMAHKTDWQKILIEVGVIDE